MIRLESTPRSIASRARCGRASTAKRRRSVGSRSRRLIRQGISRRGARREQVGGRRNGGCSEVGEVRGGGVWRRRARVPRDRPGAGAAATRARGPGRDMGALAGGGGGAGPGVHGGGGVQDLPPAGARVGGGGVGG